MEQEMREDEEERKELTEEDEVDALEDDGKELMEEEDMEEEREVLCGCGRSGS